MTSFGISTLVWLWRTRESSNWICLLRTLLGSRRYPFQAVQNGARVAGRGGGDQLVRSPPGQPHRVRVPRVELAQVAPGALDAQVLLRGRDHPAQLVRHLRRRRLALVTAEQAREAPRIAERPAGEHDRVRAGPLEGVEHALVVGQAAREDDRRL